VRRALASIILLTLITSAAMTGMICPGWELSSSARMDCCAAMGHDCPDQDAADACCGRAAQARQRFESVPSISLPTPTVAALPIMPPAADRTARSAAAAAFERVFWQHPHSPPLSRSSVLLI
jgi:hypothetical protein